MRPELSCRDLVELLTDYVEGELSEDDQARVDAHLAVCPPCVEVLAQMRQVKSLVGRLGDEHVEALSPERRATLVETFQRVR